MSERDRRPSRSWLLVCLTIALSVVAVDARTARGDGLPDLPRARTMIERALTFMDKDTVKWRQEHGCPTCHHGPMTIWALSEAKSQGYPVNEEALGVVLQWAKDHFLPFLRPYRDPRPGWSSVNTPMIYMGVMSKTLPVLSRNEIDALAIHLARHQESDGGFANADPRFGAPPTFESRETVSLLAYLAWSESASVDPKDAEEVRSGRQKLAAWLTATTPSDSTQAAAWRLLVDVRDGKSAPQLQSGVERLLRRQNADGGWSQIPELASDAYATGQALYALSFAGVKLDRSEVGRAVSFLLANQRPDGSWPMTHRNHPGIKANGPIGTGVPITYFGSAWATLGLVRLVPAPPDTPLKRQRAFDTVRAFHGTYEVDEGAPDRPVVGVDLSVYWKMSDEILADITETLQAFPRLARLRFKSARITDAGLAHLRRFPELRSVTLENAAITDAGLDALKAFTALERVNLKGTKVTDSGVQSFLKERPGVTVER